MTGCAMMRRWSSRSMWRNRSATRTSRVTTTRSTALRGENWLLMRTVTRATRASPWARPPDGSWASGCGSRNRSRWRAGRPRSSPVSFQTCFFVHPPLLCELGFHPDRSPAPSDCDALLPGYLGISIHLPRHRVDALPWDNLARASESQRVEQVPRTGDDHARMHSVQSPYQARNLELRCVRLA